VFNSRLEKKAEILLDEQNEKELQKDETVFESFIRKRKEKRKSRKEQKKLENAGMRLLM
jgi:hypothetical protein